MSEELEDELLDIIRDERESLHERIEERHEQLKQDDRRRFELYAVLGLGEETGFEIDLYQNIGRFLYRRAGSLLERTTQAVFRDRKGGESIRIENRISENPNRFQIDSFVEQDNKAHEIKWRDATTDGDHVRKEHEKVRSIREVGLVPVRIMFFMPQRRSQERIQERIIAAYEETGESYVTDAAWRYVAEYTGFDLQSFLYDHKREMELGLSSA